MSNVNIFLTKSKLVYVFYTPIPIRMQYTALKFHPIPLTGYKKYFIFDDLDIAALYAINSKITEYTQINLNKCKSLLNLKICEITAPIYSTNHSLF